MPKLYTAVIYTEIEQLNGSRFLKYRNVAASGVRFRRFLEFAARFPGAHHVNFYDPSLPKGRNFVFQHRF